MGPSGSGKSTLMNLIGCLDTPTSGSYLLKGREIARMDDDELARIRNKEIGFIFQTFNLLPHRSALDNVMLAEVYIGAPREGRRERALAGLARVGLANRSSFLPTKMSGGQQQRVAIARALMGSPSLLLCDEPTGNLDSVSTASILELFAELGEEGLTLVVVTHDEQVAALAHREVRIVDGRLTEIAR
jgi:ABC-type lipoprotein export system ATPase subunit